MNIEDMNNEKSSKVSLIYESGKVKPFDGENKREGVKYVLLEDGWQRLAISLRENQVPILKARNKPDGPVREGRFFVIEATAVNDFDGQAGTAALVSQVPDLREHLSEYGEYIPALGQLMAIHRNLDEVNEALRYVGGNPIRGGMWSSTEQGPRTTWLVYFPYGKANYVLSGSYFLRTIKTWRTEP